MAYKVTTFICEKSEQASRRNDCFQQKVNNFLWNEGKTAQHIEMLYIIVLPTLIGL